MERIRRHRREQVKRRTTLGPRWRDPVDELGRTVALVCDRGDGFFIYPHPDTRLHDVRHAVATELGRQGVQPVIVSAVLGHASPSLTIAVYQHAWQEGPSEAAAALEAALGPFPRWQSVGTRGPGTINGPSAGDEHAGQEGWGGEDSNHRPADYESAKKEAIYQEERAEEARRPGLIVLTMIRKFPAVSNLEGYQLGYQYPKPGARGASYGAGSTGWRAGAGERRRVGRRDRLRKLGSWSVRHHDVLVLRQPDRPRVARYRLAVHEHADLVRS